MQSNIWNNKDEKFKRFRHSNDVASLPTSQSDLGYGQDSHVSKKTEAVWPDAVPFTMDSDPFREDWPHW